MARTRVFVSYSHQDSDLLTRFQQHTAVLERLELLDLWADTRISGGAEWEREIEDALTNAKVAVLLISPAFLASKYIWANEMPRIEAHCGEGMEAVPLIIRSCPWRLERFLANLAARPRDGKALSLMNEGEIDFELSNFVYELAAKIGKSPTPAPRALDAVSQQTRIPEREASDYLTGRWDGFYNDTQRIRLVVRRQNAGSFQGKMEYPKEGIITSVEGNIDRRWSPNDAVWRQINRGSAELAVTFQELAYERRGSGAGISFDGKYYGFVAENQISGAWFTDTRLVGFFALKRKSSIR